MAHAALNRTLLDDPPHPYYPLGVEIAGYLANSYSVPFLLGTFAVGCAVLSFLTHLIVRRNNPHLPTGELATVMWFVLTGCIHLFFEGYFAVNFKTMGESSHLFAQMWKEYAFADSRYLTQNAFVLCMESITAAFWGPLSFVVAAMIIGDHPYRYPLQAIVSLGQIYGDILYYATSMFDHYILDVQYFKPGVYYFWVYYFGLNFIWIVIPSYLLYTSATVTARVFKAMSKVEKGLQANGAVKKEL